MDIRDFWSLSAADQDEIRKQLPNETDEDHQAFLNALFPAYGSFAEADESLDLSDTQGKENPA